MSGDRAEPVAPAKTVAPAVLPANTQIESQLLQTLRDAKAALESAQLDQASQLMQSANSLCESAMRDPASLSRSGLAQIQQLFADCLEAGKPLHDELVQRMSESAAVGKAKRAYQPRRPSTRR